jgi:hypothetical protein
MNDGRELAPWEESRSTRPRAIPFRAHVGALFADTIVTFVAAVSVSWLFALGLFLVPRLSRTPQVLVDFSVWILLTLYTLMEVVFAMSPGKWFADTLIRAASGAPALRWRLALRWAIKCSPLLFMDLDAALRLLNWFLGRDYPVFTLANRTLLQQLAGVALYTVMIGCLLAILPSRRTLHDWIAGTAVFHRFEMSAAVERVERGFEVQGVSPGIEPAIASDLAPVAPASQNSGQGGDPR